MPSGSKKRKSSKKPKTSSQQGEPPELETGFEEGMAKDGDETGECPPSPKITEGDPEAMAEGGLAAKEINGEVLQQEHVEPEEIKESSLTEEAFAPPHQQENCQGDDPPSQADPELDIRAVMEGEAPARVEPEGEAPIIEIAQGKPLLQIKPETDTPLIQTDTATDAEIKQEIEMDAVLTGFKGDTDAAPDAPAEEFKPEADIRQDETEFSIESASVERELEPSAPPIVSESRTDESPVETASEDAVPTVFEGDTYAAADAPTYEFKSEADIGQDEIELSIESAPVERDSEPSTPPVVSESRMDESPVEIAPEDAAPTAFEGDTDAAPDAPAGEFKPEADIGKDETELSVESALAERELEPAVSESRMDESPVETAPANIEPEIDKAPVETEAGIDAAPVEVEPEIDEPTDEIKPETDALPAHIEPETDEAPVETDGAPADISPEMEEALVERESEMDVAPVPEMDAAPTDSEQETDVAQVETDAFPVEVQPEIDADVCGIETQTDAAAWEIETDLLGNEPETEATPSDIKPEVNAAPIDTEQNEVAQAEIELEPEPEVEALPEVQAEEEVQSLDTSLEIEAEEPLQKIEREPKPEPEEPPQEIEPEPKSEPEEPPQEIESEAKPEPEDPSEDASLEIEAKEIEPEPKVEVVEDASVEIEAKMEPPQEIEPEPEVETVDEGLAEIKEDDKMSADAELGEQNLVEGDVGASLETNPESKVGTSHEIESEVEAEVSLEVEKKPEMEALAEAKSDEKGCFETESDQQDLVEIEPEQTDLQEHDQQELSVDAPEVPVIEDELGDQVEPVHDQQPHIVDAPEVPVIEDELGDQIELPAISASDRAILVDDSIPVIEASLNIDNEGPGNEQEFLGKPDEAEDISPSVVVLEGEGEGTEEGVSDNQDPGKGLEQDRETAVDNEQGVLDELVDTSKEDIDEQERAGDYGPTDDQFVLASVGDGSEMVVPCEQELGIELPLADAFAVEECAMEGVLLNNQMVVTEQPELSIDEQERLGAADQPPSAESELVEQGLKTILPSSESEMTLDPYEPKDEAVTSADKEKVAFEREFNLESSAGELEIDIGEEEAASSTVAEAGSVFNDFDETVHYEHELHSDIPSSVHIPDSRDFEDTLSSNAPELVEAGLEEQLDSEPYPTKQQRFITESNGNEVKQLTDEVDLKVGQGLGHPCEQAEVHLESVDVAEAAKESHASFVEGLPGDVQPLSSPRPDEVVQDSGEDKVHIFKERLAANKELDLVEEERAACEDSEGAATSILGIGSAKEFPTIAGNELMSKVLTTEVDGQYSLSRSEAPSNDLLDLRDESSIHHSELNSMDEAEIHAVEAKELKGAELNLVGGDSSNDASTAPVQSVSSDPQGRDIGVQAFRQESDQEASLPVVVPTQDRALEHVNPKSSGGVIVEGRKKWLGCCGMFDVLLGKN